MVMKIKKITVPTIDEYERAREIFLPSQEVLLKTRDKPSQTSQIKTIVIMAKFSSSFFH